MPCSAGHGQHLVVPIVVDGEVVQYLVSAETAVGDTGAPRLLDALLERMASEIGRSHAATITSSARFPELVGRSPAMQRAREDLQQALAVSYPVLVEGESGTGKDLVAWLLHHRGQRRAGPWVSLNCAALPEQLLESELFGHRRGAFTGAVRDKPGLLKLAQGGTLFLDEVQQLSLAAQAKMLRAVESGEFMELGGEKLQRSNARVVAATNADLEHAVAEGRFRMDLYYRLSVLRIQLPALRQVREDIPLLVRHLVRLICDRQEIAAPAVAPATMASLMASAWPGNVRQLLHELERALLRSGGRTVQVEHLSSSVRTVAFEPGGFQETRAALLRAFEREEIERGLERTGGNLTRLARELGISRRGLFGKVVLYGLRPAGSDANE